MEMKVELPFQKLLELVKRLPPTQQNKLVQELSQGKYKKINKTHFLDFLLKGPVYSEKEIAIIKENRKRISAWRTKN